MSTFGSIPLTLAEKKRRDDRKARFNKPPGNLTVRSTSHKASEAGNLLLQPLSSSRTKLPLRPKTTEFTATDSVSQFVGTNQSLEKPYLRLTTFPRTELVRPLPILEQALAHIKRRYSQTEDFEWCNEQLKSVRQDLTVQAIRTPFALDVYETHARILLEHGDLDEFNQCQCNIRQYTSPSSAVVLSDECMGVSPTKPLCRTQRSTTLRQSEQSAREFRAYAVLYSLIRHAATDLTLQLQKRPERSRIASSDKSVKSKDQRRRKKKSRKESTPNEMSNGAVAVHPASGDDGEVNCEDHALAVVCVVQHVNPVAFFRLYQSAPHMSAYLMDFLVQRVRTAAYAAIMASYRPDVTIEWMQQRLKFSDVPETMHFLRSQQAVIASDGKINCQQSSCALSR